MEENTFHEHSRPKFSRVPKFIKKPKSRQNSVIKLPKYISVRFLFTTCQIETGV